MAESVRRRSWGGVLPLGRQASISGSSLIQCASVSIALSSFQEEQNARHHKQFKLEQALTLREAARRSQRSPDTVARWCASLGIGVRDERGRWRVDPTKLDALIEARRVLGLDESAEADSEQDRNRSGGPKQRGGAVMAHLPVDREQIAQFVKTQLEHRV